TTMGTIEVRLDATRAPVTVKNFTDYAESGFYDGTIFHRVIEGFMIQGGGFTSDMAQKKTAAKIVNEARGTESNRRGTVAMARTSEPHSATSQFFINTSNNDFLDADKSRDGWGYAVFGRVTRGMDVVDKISLVRTGKRGFYSDVPVTPVLIKSVRIIDTTRKAK
ncbi:MAG: peptidylprolyl isomerase, partial [Sutterella sp.]|nr:peptidylprolyl isomerase [Sutterella sp.]